MKKILFSVAVLAAATISLIKSNETYAHVNDLTLNNIEQVAQGIIEVYDPTTDTGHHCVYYEYENDCIKMSGALKACPDYACK